jgi:MFS family permease
MRHASSWTLRIKADAWGRKPIFLVALAILPIRGALYTLSDDRSWLVAIQLLDGVGAGIFGALTPAGRSHARHGPLQCKPGRSRHHARDRRIVQ